MGRGVVPEETVDDDLPKSRYQRHLLILSIDDNQLVRDIISRNPAKKIVDCGNTGEQALVLFLDVNPR